MDTKTKLQKIEISRVDYEIEFGLRPDRNSIGAIIQDDVEHITIHYIFLSTKQEVAVLERL